MSAHPPHRRRPGDLPPPADPADALATEEQLLATTPAPATRTRARSSCGASCRSPAASRCATAAASSRARTSFQVASLGLVSALRALRPRARRPVRGLRRADDPRRAAPPLPRPRLDAARAARPAGEHPRGRGRDHQAQPRARALPDGRRDRRAARDQRGRRAGGVRGQRARGGRCRSTGRPRARAPSPATRRRWPSGSAARTPATSWSRTARRSTRAPTCSTRPSARSCGCASPRT